LLVIEFFQSVAGRLSSVYLSLLLWCNTWSRRRGSKPQPNVEAYTHAQ